MRQRKLRVLRARTDELVAKLDLLVCRLVGHKGGPWERLVLMGNYFMNDCPRCGTHRTFTPDTGWYAEFSNKELTKKGYL